MSLSDRLKKARDVLKKTQKEMAAALGISVQMWQVYESGKSVPGGNVLAELAKVGINVNWLLTGKGEIKNEVGGDDCIAERFRIMRGTLSTSDFLQKLGFKDNEKIEFFSQKLRNIEDEKEYPSYSDLVFILQESGVNPNWLFGYEETMYRKDLNVSTTAIDFNLLRDIVKEAVVYENVNPGSLSPEKKAELIIELYRMRSKNEEVQQDLHLESVQQDGRRSAAQKEAPQEAEQQSGRRVVVEEDKGEVNKETAYKQ